MTGDVSAPARLLEDALDWARDCLELARDQPPGLPTPCSEWDLRALLAHIDDGLAALVEAAELGQVSVDPLARREPGPIVDRILERACALRARWRTRVTSAPVQVGDLSLGRDTLLLIGALEATVHGWDVAAACGARRPPPEQLAESLYDVALALVPPTDRGRRFAEPLATGPRASRGERLLAHLGRAGAWSAREGVDGTSCVRQG